MGTVIVKQAMSLRAEESQLKGLADAIIQNPGL